MTRQQQLLAEKKLERKASVPLRRFQMRYTPWRVIRWWDPLRNCHIEHRMANMRGQGSNDNVSVSRLIQHMLLHKETVVEQRTPDRLR